jgi:P27 family predicted phage terminase small subunit
MGLRGRKSAEHLNVVRVGPERPKPPHKISKAGRKVWKDIVDSHPPGYFRKGAIPLLFAYCEAVAVHSEACELIKKGLLIKTAGGSFKQNPAIAIQTAKAGEMGMLASKLRLATSSYRDRDVAGAESREKPESKRKGMAFGDD